MRPPHPDRGRGCGSAGRRVPVSGRGTRRRHDAAGQAPLEARPGAVDRLAGACRKGRCSSRRRTGRRRRRRWSPRSCARASRLAHNRSGANLVSGVASTLLGSRGAELGLFEVDEAALPEVARRVRPRAVLLGNLFRDQLDRYGELEHVAERWRTARRDAARRRRSSSNADDPLVGDARDACSGGARLRARRSARTPGRRSSTPPTRSTASRCGTPYEYAAAYVGHLGDYRCPNVRARAACRSTSPRARSSWTGSTASTFTLATPAGRLGCGLRFPGSTTSTTRCGGCVARARARRAARRRSSPGLERFSAAFGRFERIAIGDKRLLMLLIKNPAGANEAVRTLVDGGAAARRRRRAERRDRRRARRLVDLGRRLRAAARAASSAGRDRRRAPPSSRCASPTAASTATGSRSSRISRRRSTAASS